MSTKRPIRAIAVPGVEPNDIISSEPIFEWVDPRKLLVDEAYQRNLSERSVALIRKIVGAWSWARMKPPIVVQTEDGLEVIDGQHTAIAAASHPGIRKIPVMLVEADSLAERAGAFLGHNADRIAVTPLQMHHAAVLAGDEMALTIAQVCERAGVVILKAPPGREFKPSECLAVSTIKALINRRGAMGARRVLEVCRQAHCAPVGMSEIRGVELLLFADDLALRLDAADIASALMTLGPRADQMAKAYAANNSVRQYEGMAAILRRKVGGHELRRAS